MSDIKDTIKELNKVNAENGDPRLMAIGPEGLFDAETDEPVDTIMESLDKCHEALMKTPEYADLMAQSEEINKKGRAMFKAEVEKRGLTIPPFLLEEWGD